MIPSRQIGRRNDLRHQGTQLRQPAGVPVSPQPTGLTLPSGDADYATQWGIIKRSVSRVCAAGYKRPEWINASKHKHRGSTIWQRRYWEHQIRDEQDFARHVDYIYYNPVKHGACKRVIDRSYSTFHQDVTHSDYAMGWPSAGLDAKGEAFGKW